MASANTSYTDLITTTLEFRAADIADNVTANNAVTAWIKANGGYKLTGGGSKILEPLAFAANTNGGWYNGYDQLPVGSQEEFSAAEFAWKQIAVPVVASGLETDVQNTGKEAVFDLLEERIKNAERTASNLVTTGLFSEQLTGLLALCPTTPTTGTYGGINRATATNAFWRPKHTDLGAHATATTIFSPMNTMFNSLIRGTDKPDLVVTDATNFGFFETQMQSLQRFTSPKAAELGFEALKFKTADFVLDGTCTTDAMFFLNTKYLKLRVSKNRNFKALPARQAFNQDASVVILAAALNLTCSNSILQGRLQLDD
jgi:hypothetical protein